MKKRIFIVILSIVLLTACSKERIFLPNDEKKDTFVVGIFEPLSGIYGETGRETLRGATLAHESRRYLLNKPVEIAVYNTRSQIFEAANGVSFLSSTGAIGLIGTFGSDSMNLAAPVIDAAEIPTITGSTSGDLKGHYWITQASIRDEEQGAAMAIFADKQLHLKDIAIMIDAETRYGEALAWAFMANLPDYVNTYKIYYHTGESRFHNEIQRLAKFPVDGIYCPGDAAASASLVRAIKKRYPDMPIMGADRWENPSFKAIGKEAVEGVYFSCHYARYETFNQASDIFLAAYRKKYQSEPTSYAAIGYDAYHLLLDAAEETQSTDAKAIGRYLRQRESFDGALGISKRYGTRSVPIMKQQGKKGNYVTSVEVKR